MDQLEQQFIPQDQDAALQVWTVLPVAPTLIRPAIELTLEGWNVESIGRDKAWICG